MNPSLLPVVSGLFRLSIRKVPCLIPAVYTRPTTKTKSHLLAASTVRICSKGNVKCERKSLKGKVTPFHTVKAYGGSTGIVSLILNFCARWSLVVDFRPRPHYPRERTRYPLKRRLGGPQSQLRLEKRKSLSSTGL